MTGVHSTPARRQVWRSLLILLLVGALVRAALLVPWGNSNPRIIDARIHHDRASVLATTGRYADGAGNLTSLRPPLFPAMAAAVYRVLGTDSLWGVYALNAVISLVTTVMTFWLGKAVYDQRTGLLAATFHCFYPSLLGFNNLLLSEVLFTFFVAAGALLSVRQVQEGRVVDGLLLGLCLGLGALTRSVLWLFAPLLALLLLLFGRAPMSRRAAGFAVTLLALSATIAPWAYRNTRLHDTFVTIDVMGGRNVMMGNYEYTPLERSWATINTVRGDRSWHRVLASHTPDYAELTQGQIDKAAMGYGVRFFFTHPWLSAQRSVVKFFDFWQLERTLVAGAKQGVFGPVPKSLWIGLALLVCGSYALAMFLAIFASVVVPPQSWRVHGLLLFWIAFPCLIHSVVFAHSRYHLPLMPIILVFSAAALINWRQMRARARGCRLIGAGLLCALLVIGWLWELLAVDLRWFAA